MRTALSVIWATACAALLSGCAPGASSDTSPWSKGGTPATSCTQHGPDQMPNFKELKVSDIADFYGYSIEITSICSTEIRCDLLAAP